MCQHALVTTTQQWPYKWVFDATVPNNLQMESMDVCGCLQKSVHVGILAKNKNNPNILAKNANVLGTTLKVHMCSQLHQYKYAIHFETCMTLDIDAKNVQCVLKDKHKDEGSGEGFPDQACPIFSHNTIIHLSSEDDGNDVARDLAPALRVAIMATMSLPMKTPKKPLVHLMPKTMRRE